MSPLEHIEKHHDHTHEDDNAGLGSALDYMRENKNKAVKSFVNNKGLFVGLILVFILILVFTTNINFQSSAEVMKLSLTVFVFGFCSYTMYVNCADSGTRAGKNTSAYRNAKTDYEDVKTKIVEGKKQHLLGDFCRAYIDEELRNARNEILEGVGLEYKDYIKKWVGEDKATIKASTDLSEREKDAVIAANSIKPLKLTPEMILRRERTYKRRAPLGKSPHSRRNIQYITKLISTIVTSIFTCMLALEVIGNPSWATFAELCLKLLMVLLSGFSGYKMGYENITIDTVNYIQDQTDLLHQFEQYLEQQCAEKCAEANNG